MTDSSSSFLTSNLVLRVLSALVLIPVVLGAVWWGDWAYNGLIMVVCVLGMDEWLGLTAKNMSQRGRIILCISVAIILLTVMVKGFSAAFGLSLLAMVIAGYYSVRGRGPLNPSMMRNAFGVSLGIPYLAWSAMAMIHLRAQPEHGLFLTVYMLLVVWGTDIGAYFAGRMIGGPKLLPKISPKKTWAGLFGGMALAAALGYAAARGFGESLPGLYVAAGIVLAAISQAGDFFESYVKRVAGAKDSGTLIPGHGGVLDRVDGLLFVALTMGIVSLIRG